MFYNTRHRSARWLDHDKVSWGFPKPKLPPEKTTVTVWWCSAGFVHRSFFDPDETITTHVDKVKIKKCIYYYNIVYNKSKFWIINASANNWTLPVAHSKAQIIIQCRNGNRCKLLQENFFLPAQISGRYNFDKTKKLFKLYLCYYLNRR